ncbi:histone H2A.Z-specific chaperone CHZ1-like [Lycium barbarum]|uniref:histone H2A.Z-specific chaperone CHZ1-like n=1 Tax=Lycium barbarum TaxID=112863 RepID=UPI00293E8E6B|nr:histone H2A.Z-specific chaperone CHZ1-like [Lycium barbarum]
MEKQKRGQNTRGNKQIEKQPPNEAKDGSNNKQQLQRGREIQNNKRNVNRNRRGQSEPPQTMFKPTGVIFGLDKPWPISGAQTNGDNNKEQHKNNFNKEEEEERLKSTKGQKNAHDDSNTSFKSFMIDEPDKLEVVLFEEGWESAGKRKNRRFDSKREPEKIKKNQENLITQNSFDELLQEGNLDVGKSAPVEGEEGNHENEDEWAEVTSSSEEENTSDESDEEDSEEEESGTDEDNVKKTSFKEDIPCLIREAAENKNPKREIDNAAEGNSKKINITKNQKKESKKSSKHPGNV